MLGSCIFLFVKHPFDIGDRVDVGDKSYVVERISLLYSVLRNVDDHRMTQVPNNILNTLWIDNFSRSNAMYEQLKIPVSIDTTFADIQFLREEMERFVWDKDNCRDFQPEIDVEVVGVGDMDKLELRVDIRHKSNWSNETVRAARRSKFMCALVLAIRKIPIRAPGATAEEEKKDGDDKGDDTDDDKKDTDTAGDKPTQPAGGAEPPSSGQNESGQGLTAPAAAGGLVTTSQNTGQSTGVDNRLSSGSIYHRGSANLTQSSEAAIADRLNSRSPGADIARDDGNQEGLQPGAGAEPSRAPSTGRRKAGLRTSNDLSASIPAPLSNIHAGTAPSSSGVPILGTPVPPSRGSARYEPPSQQFQDRDHPLPNIFSPERDYQGTYLTYQPHQSAYDPVPVEGGSRDDRDRRSGSGPPVSALEPGQYYTPSRYDPVSPPSLYPLSPPPPPPAAPVPAAAPDGHRKPSFLSKALKRSSKQSE